MTSIANLRYAARSMFVGTVVLLTAACADDDAAHTQAVQEATARDAGALRDGGAPRDGGAQTRPADAGARHAAHDAGAHAQRADAAASQHASCSEPYTKDPRDDTMTGELVRLVTGDNGTPGDPADDPYDVLLPQEMLDWLSEQNWIQEHGDWHNTRRCKQGCMRMMPGGVCQTSESLTARGLECAPIQEGEPGDGYAFLVMHRHMIRGFKQAFPKHVELIRSFYRIPTGKADPENPIPWVEVRWSEDEKRSFDWMENIVQHMDAFASEDDYAKWVQFGDHFFGTMGGLPGAGFSGFPGMPSGPAPAAGGGTPSASAADADADGGTGERPGNGIHGPLHGQWTVRGSSSGLTDNNKNVKNFAFWRLHGWLDDMWERFRVAKGLSEYDPDYQQALIEQCEEMHRLGQAPPLTEEQLRSMQPPAAPEKGVFATQVAPMFNAYCGGSVCHDGQSPTLGLALAATPASVVRQGLVGQRATEYDMALIEPGQPNQSWLYRKLTDNFTDIDCSRSTCTGMPLGSQKPNADALDQLKRWIESGATAD